mmetsp:Transcript_6893/g.16895  ORF Transcript_6893/g.16895 Transcript_6893/m.16895 type:complete len:304 (+) Transcript_6893:150-1061(+)
MVSSILAVLTFISAIRLNQVYASDSNLSWSIYHSWKPGQEFVRRGNLVWGTKSSTGDENDDKKEFQIVNDDESASLTPKDIREMLEYGWYHIKIQGDNGNEDDNFVFQTVPACNLFRANFKDQFEITLPRSSLSGIQDRMTSFAYTPLVSPLAPKTCGDYDDNDDSGDGVGNVTSFSSRVSVLLDTPAMTVKTILSPSKPPPGISFVKQPRQPNQQGQQGGGNAEAFGDGEDPPTPPTPFSFLSKYWYIILPMMILQFMTVPEETPEQGQQQGQQGGNQDTGGTVSPPTTTSTQKTRRGKTRK